MYVRIFGVGEFKNCTDFSSVQGMEAIFACMVGFAGSANSNMLSKFFNKGCCYVNKI